VPAKPKFKGYTRSRRLENSLPAMLYGMDLADIEDSIITESINSALKMLGNG
jgi:hypothetical protein